MTNLRPAIVPVLTLLVLALLGGCRGQEISSPALLTVNGRTVTLERFKAEFARTLPQGQQLSEEDRRNLQRSYLAETIDRELALGEAQRLGVDVGEEELDAAVGEWRRDYPAGTLDELLAQRGITPGQWRDELRDELLMEKLVLQEVTAKLAVSAEQVGAYYREHREEFSRPAQVQARQIVAATEEEGRAALALLKEGKPFGEVARRYSLSPDRELGGDLGFFGRGEMPAEFDAVVFALPVGQLSDLVETGFGYHIFLVEQRREAVRLSLEDASEEISRQLLAQQEEQAYQQWLQRLRGQASIEIDWSQLQGTSTER